MIPFFPPSPVAFPVPCHLMLLILTRPSNVQCATSGTKLKKKVKANNNHNNNTDEQSGCSWSAFIFQTGGKGGGVPLRKGHFLFYILLHTQEYNFYSLQPACWSLVLGWPLLFVVIALVSFFLFPFMFLSEMFPMSVLSVVLC